MPSGFSLRLKPTSFGRKALNDPEFQRADFVHVIAYCVPDFAIGATCSAFLLVRNQTTIIIRLNNDDIHEFNEFPVMVEMGFFALTGQRYQMVIPKRLTMARVKKAALRFAQSEDADGILRPECLVVTMPYEEAGEWQSRLRNMDPAHRDADRISLLET